MLPPESAPTLWPAVYLFVAPGVPFASVTSFDRYVEKTKAEPSGVSLATYPTKLPELAEDPGMGFFTGSAGEVDPPVMMALPEASTARPYRLVPVSLRGPRVVPPKRVQYASFERSGVNLATNPTLLVTAVVWKAPGVTGSFGGLIWISV